MLLRSGRVELALPVGQVTTVGRTTPELQPLWGGEKRISRTQLRLTPTDDGHLLVECMGPNNSAYRLHGDECETALTAGATVTLSEGDELSLLQSLASSTLTVALTQKRAKVANSAPPPAAPLTIATASRLALGTLALGIMYPDNKRPSWDESVAIVRAAVATGVSFIDTSDCYCADGDEIGYAERVIGEALRDIDTSRAFVATKGGMGRRKGNQSSSSWMPGSTTPDGTKANIRRSHAALGGRRAIDLWQVHHPPSRDEALVACMRAAHDMVKEGLVRFLGLCNMSVRQIKAVQAAGIPIVSVQNELSIWKKTASNALKDEGGATGVVDYCAAHGITFIAYSPLGGLKTRRGDISCDRFPKLVAAARKRGVDPYSMLLRVMRVRFPTAILLVGSRDVRKVSALRTIDDIALTDKEATELWQ